MCMGVSSQPAKKCSFQRSESQGQYHLMEEINGFVDGYLNFEVSSKPLAFIFNLQIYTHSHKGILEKNVRLNLNTFKTEN